MKQSHKAYQVLKGGHCTADTSSALAPHSMPAHKTLKLIHTYLYSEAHVQTNLKEALAGWGHSTASLHLFCVKFFCFIASYFIFRIWNLALLHFRFDFYCVSPEPLSLFSILNIVKCFIVFSSVRPGPKRLIVLTTNKQSKQCLSSVAGPENKQTNKQQYKKLSCSWN